MLFNRFFTLIVLITLYNCDSKKITDKNDYIAFISPQKEILNTSEDVVFWTKKLNQQPNQYPYLAKRAKAYTALFNSNGNIENLIKAENDLLAANEITNYSNTSYLKALSHNYISQHKFKQALIELKKAETIGENLRGTHKMLFDVSLELGNDSEAEHYLGLIKNFSDFDFLIRLSKWEDHNGNLHSAITVMKQATKIAESSNNKVLKQWSYTNLADFYGHAGKIEKSYKYYLKALELDANDAYAKKGIAWIVYSHEKNPEEALAILNHITSYYNAPDYNLLKAEIAEFKQDAELKNKSLKTYITSVNNELYGEMYNKYNVLLFADALQLPQKALEIAENEVKNRATTQSYDLLAWSHFKNGNTKKASEIIDSYVFNKTSEPDVLYHIAEIYKAIGKTSEVEELKEELLASVYELGPVMQTKIEQL